MKPNVGTLLFGAALFSLLAPKRRLSLLAPKRRGRAATPEAAPAPQPVGPHRMYALVQTKPQVVVLAVSASVAELEREIAELNETWNHWELRSQRHRFEIHAAPALYAEPSSPARRREPVLRG